MPAGHIPATHFTARARETGFALLQGQKPKSSPRKSFPDAFVFEPALDVVDVKAPVEIGWRAR